MDGILIIDKPKGYTSHDIVNIIRKALNTKKVGHTGTLDPNATGVLPILIGKATKISKYLIEHDKTYIATIKLGQKTDTGDSEGKVIEEKEHEKQTEEKLTEVLNNFLGKQKQIPPMYSAIKKNGKKLYEYARNNETVKIEPRDIEIYNIELLKYEEDIIFKVKCSKGTYIRVLCEDIAKKLNTIGYMKELQRIEVNNLTIQNAVSLEEVSQENIKKQIITIEQIFNNKEKIELNNELLNKFLNGVKLDINLKDGIYSIYINKKFIGLGIVNNKILKRDIVI